MKLYSVTPLLLSALFFISGIRADIPEMKAVHQKLEVHQGSNVTLECLGHKVNELDTRVFWKFNGHLYKKSTNKKTINNKFHREENKGNFSLRITNVSEQDVGRYTCVAEVFNFGTVDFGNASIDLTLYKKVPKVATTQHNITVKKRSTVATTSYQQQTPTRSQTTQKFRTSAPPSNAKVEANLLRTILFITLGLIIGLLMITLLIRFWRKRHKPPPTIRPPPDVDENSFKYDVFITYSRKDFPWVEDELLSLFRENQVQYCIDHRDFELGKAFLESMADSVYQSRKVLAVWSGSYASSKYCKQELDYALQRSFEYSDCSVIVIRLDKTDRKQLPKPLRAKTFLDYSDSVERKGWEKRLITHLKGPGKKSFSIRTIV